MALQRAPVQRTDQQPPQLDLSACLTQGGQGGPDNSFLIDLLGLSATALANPGAINPFATETGRSLAQQAIPVARKGATDLIDAASGLEHGLIDGVEEDAAACSPTLGAAATWWGDRMHFATDAMAGFGKGSVDLVADGGEMLADPVAAAQGMVALQSHLPGNPLHFGRMALEAVQGRRDPWDLSGNLWDALVGSDEDAQILGAAGNKLVEPYLDAWEQGRPGEIIGRLASQALPDLVGEGLGVLAGKAARVGEGFAVAPEIGAGKEIAAIEDGADVVNAPELLTKEKLDPLLRRGMDYANKLPGAHPWPVEDVVSTAQVQGPEEFMEQWIAKKKAGIPIKWSDERKAAALAEIERQAPGVEAYTDLVDVPGGLGQCERRSVQMFFREDVHPAMWEELAHHESCHAVAKPGGFPGDSGIALEEALAQWNAARALGRPVVNYPVLQYVAEELEGVLGVDGMESGLGEGSYRTFKKAEGLDTSRDLPYWATYFDKALQLERG